MRGELLGLNRDTRPQKNVVHLRSLGPCDQVSQRFNDHPASHTHLHPQRSGRGAAPRKLTLPLPRSYVLHERHQAHLEPLEPQLPRRVQGAVERVAVGDDVPGVVVVAQHEVILS